MTTPTLLTPEAYFALINQPECAKEHDANLDFVARSTRYRRQALVIDTLPNGQVLLTLKWQSRWVSAPLHRMRPLERKIAVWLLKRETRRLQRLPQSITLHEGRTVYTIPMLHEAVPASTHSTLVG